MKNKAHYLGTVAAGGPWYKGFIKAGFPPKGEGEYWFDRTGFYYTAGSVNVSLAIHSDSILNVSLGTWHAWSLRPKGNILKISWRQGNRRFISGFVLDNAEQVRDALTTKGWA